MNLSEGRRGSRIPTSIVPRSALTAKSRYSATFPPCPRHALRFPKISPRSFRCCGVRRKAPRLVGSHLDSVMQSLPGVRKRLECGEERPTRHRVDGWVFHVIVLDVGWARCHRSDLGHKRQRSTAQAGRASRLGDERCRLAVQYLKFTLKLARFWAESGSSLCPLE